MVDLAINKQNGYLQQERDLHRSQNVLRVIIRATSVIQVNLAYQFYGDFLKVLWIHTGRRSNLVALEKASN